jgi:hypothetical protein
MPETIIRFPRPFQLWTFAVSYRSLLFRSTKSASEKSRIDVYCQNVQLINVPTVMQSLAISLESAESKETLCRQLGLNVPKQHKLYQINYGTSLGQVLANNIVWHEDTLEYYDPSFFSADFPS